MGGAGERGAALASHRAVPGLPLEGQEAPGRFVGREAELAALRELLRDERLVTVLGPPGMGKTRLALRLAQLEGASYQGVHLVDLAEVRTACDLVAATAQALGVSLAGASGEEELAQLGAAIAARGCALFLFDNAEYVAAEAGPVLAGWLERAPGARFLVTSIVRLGLAAEACFELHGLSPAEAVELYETRARRVAGSVAAERHAVEQLVARLDRVPLAIELAAARARVLRPRQLLTRLDDGFEVLRGASASRHPSVLAAIRWSWELLEPWEADALAQCAVFAGGFTLDAAEAVLDLSPHPDAPPILDVLEALRDKSFLQLDPIGPSDEAGARFRLLESIRAWAAARLEEAGSAGAARDRHARFFVALADRGWDGAPDTVHLRRLVAERENLRAAHRHLLDGAPADAARAALALARVLALRGPPLSEAGVLEAGVQSARRAEDGLLLARVLRARALARIRHGALAGARADLEEACALASAAGDRRVVPHVSIEIGRLLHAEGRFDEACAHLTEWMEAARTLELPFLEGYACNLRGMARESQGRLQESAADFEMAREIFRRVGNRRFEAIALMNLGVVLSSIGRLADAVRLFEKAIAAFREIDDRAGEADTVLNLGNAHLSAGRLDEAEELLRVGLRLERELGNLRGEALALANLGMTAHERGELRTARELLQESLGLCRASGNRHFFGVFLPFFAAVEAALGHLHEARADFAEARAYFESLGDPGCLHTLEVLEGFLELAQGAPREAVERRIAAAREVLDAPVGALRSAELAVAVRLLERAHAHRSGEAVEAERGGAADEAAIEVGPEARWFRRGGGPAVDLRRRGAPRLILRELVDQRLAAPGVGLSVEALVEAGWPGDRVLAASAAARVYVAIRTLRALGLDGVLLRQDDGYLLDPAVPLRRGGRSI